MSNNFTDLYEKYKYICELKEFNSNGHICLYIQNINPKIIKKKYDEIANFILLACKKALEISNKYNKHLFYCHVYLNNATIKNFSLTLFKKINNLINQMKPDVLDTCYIYGNTTLVKNIFNIIKIFINPVTRKKILFIQSNNQNVTLT